jgi:hypothetical protein
MRSRLATGVRATLGLATLVWRSTARDYSLLPAVLPAPVLLVLHGGRLTYILTTALLYLLPCALVLGALAAQLAPDRRRAAFWTAVGTTAAVPVFWLPTLRGYPDAGAAALVAAAVALFVADMRFRSWWTAPGIGVCLAVAILFRRHFAYGALAVLTVVAAFSTIPLLAARWRAAAGGDPAWRAGVHRTAGAIKAALWTAGALLVLGEPFVARAARTNYTTLYASYMQPPAVIIDWLGSSFGWAAWALAIAGYAAALYWRTLDRERLAVVLAVYGLTLAVWTLYARQSGEHYTLHATPVVVIGQFALVWTAARLVRGWRWALLVLFGAGYVVLNAVAAFAPSDAIPAPLRGSRWLAPSMPPPRWTDYDEMLRLVRDLRGIAGRSEPIYVAASGRLRSSAVRQADIMLNDPLRPGATAGAMRMGNQLNVPKSPQVDSRDDNPTGLLVRAAYVVVATPIQYHMDPGQQRLIRAAVEAFTHNWEISADFTPLPETYVFADDVRVRVYRRVRPTSLPVALRTLARVRAILRRPHERPRPMHLGEGEVAIREGTGDGATIEAPLRQDPVPLVFLDSAAAGTRVRAVASMEGTACGPLVVSAAALAGDTLPGPVVSATYEAGAPRTLELTLPGAGSAVLLRLSRAKVDAAPAGDCRARIHGLTLLPPAARDAR